MKIPATKPVHFSLTLHYGKINIGNYSSQISCLAGAWAQTLRKPDSSAFRVAEPVADDFIPPQSAIHKGSDGLVYVLGSKYEGCQERIPPCNMKNRGLDGWTFVPDSPRMLARDPESDYLKVNFIWSDL